MEPLPTSQKWTRREGSQVNLRPDDDDEEYKDHANFNIQQPSSNTRLKNALKKLAISYNNNATKQLEGLRNANRANLVTNLNNVANANDVSKIGRAIDQELRIFQEAWYHKDKISREKWQNAIRKEFGDMNHKQVWRKIKRNSIPKNRRCVKCKWVFKIKYNGIYHARLVACGYSQIPGVDYTKNYSPVVHDVTFPLLLILKIYMGLQPR